MKSLQERVLTNIMTKQQQTSAPEAPTVDLLRRRFKLQDEYIESIRKDNINASVPSKYLDSLIQWRGHEFIERKIVENFIAKATDQDTSCRSQISKKEV